MIGFIIFLTEGLEIYVYGCLNNPVCVLCKIFNRNSRIFYGGVMEYNNKIFNALADMYIKDTSCEGQLFCGCREEDCIQYKTKECRKCLLRYIENECLTKVNVVCKRRESHDTFRNVDVDDVNWLHRHWYE